MNYILDIHGDLDTKRKPGSIPLDYSRMAEGFRYLDLFSSGKDAAHTFIHAKYKPTAVICFNDDMAFGMIEELKRLGIRIPQDVSIIGIDGVFMRDRYEPKLTTIAIYPERQGAKCVDVLIDMLEGRDYRYMNPSPFEILEGETVKTIL